MEMCIVSQAKQVSRDQRTARGHFRVHNDDCWKHVLIYFFSVPLARRFQLHNDNFLKAISIANEKGAEVAQARTAARKASEMAGGDGSQAKLAQNTDVFKIIKMIVEWKQ